MLSGKKDKVKIWRVQKKKQRKVRDGEKKKIG